MRRFAHFLALPLLLPTLFTGACRGAQEKPPIQDAVLEMTTPQVLDLSAEDLLPVAEFTIDGGPPLRFLIDTGATGSAIEPERAHEIGLSIGDYAGSSVSTGSGGGRVEVRRYARVGEFRSQGFVASEFRLPLMDAAVFRELNLAGILGQDLLGRMVLVLDKERNQLHLLPIHFGREGVSAYLGEAKIAGGAWAIVPIEYEPRPMMRLSVSGLEDGRAIMEIDTGATSCSLTGEVLDALGLDPIRSTTLQGIGGTFQEPTYRLKDFDLYGVKFSMDVQRTGLDYGLLGMDVLSELVVAFDPSAGEFWLHRRVADGDEPAGEIDSPR